MKLSQVYFCLFPCIGLFYLVKGDNTDKLTSTGATKQELNSTATTSLPFTTTTPSTLNLTTYTNATEAHTNGSVQTLLPREPNLTTSPFTTHPMTVHVTSQQNKFSTIADISNSTTLNSNVSRPNTIQAAESGIPSTTEMTTKQNSHSTSTTVQNRVTTTQTTPSATSMVPTVQSYTDSTAPIIPVSDSSTKDQPTVVTSSPITTTSARMNTSNVPVESEAASGSLPTGASVALGIVTAVLVVALLVIIYKYQRKFLHAFRFRRLQEVPMDDFDDDGIPDAVYAEHTVPRIQFRV